MPVRFVLLRPQNPENIGAIARALKNFGFSDWVIVDPGTADWDSARRLAVQSHDVLDMARREDTLEAAIADCTWVVGTTSRQRRQRRRLSARELGTTAAERAPEGTIAIVFGNESSGLTNEELDRCHDTATVLTSPEQPSINLAQAALLFAYELRVALDAGERRAATLPAVATDAAVREVEASLASTLSAAGFLRDERQDAEHDLAAVLRRARLTKREAALWNTALRAIGRRLNRD